MGAHSTVNLTALDEATDEEISAALFALLGNRVLDNYRIVPDEGEDNAPAV